MPFFKYFPETELGIFNDGETVPIIDLFRAAAVVEDRLNEVSLYTQYTILDGARPDVVAQELYGSSELHWTFFLVNNELRDGIKMWPMSDYVLDQYVKDIHEHYGSIELTGLSQDNPYNHNLLYGLDISSPRIAIKDDRGRQYKIETYRSDRQQIGIRKGAIAEVYWSDRVDLTYKYNVAFPPYFKLKAQKGDNGAGGVCQATLNEDGTINGFRIVDFGSNYRLTPEIVSDFKPDTEAHLTFTVPQNSYGAVPELDWLSINPLKLGVNYIDSPFIEVRRAGSYDKLHIPYHIDVDTDEGTLLPDSISLTYPNQFDKNVFGQLYLSNWNIDAINGTYEQVQKGDGNNNNPYLESVLPSLYSNNNSVIYDTNTVWIKKGEYTSADFTQESGYYFIHYNDSPTSVYPMLMLRFLSSADATESNTDNFIDLKKSTIIAYTHLPYNPSQSLRHPGDVILEWIIPQNNNGYLLDPRGYETGANATHEWSDELYLSDYNSIVPGNVRSYLSYNANGYIVNQMHSQIHTLDKPINVFIPPIDVTSGNDAIQSMQSIQLVEHNDALLGTDLYSENIADFVEWDLVYSAWKSTTQDALPENHSDIFQLNREECYQDSARAKCKVSTGYSAETPQSYYEKYTAENRAKSDIRIVKPEYIRDFVREFREQIALT